MNPNPHEVVTPVVAAALNIFKAAAKVPSVKRVVYTSSTITASRPAGDKVRTVDETSWNEESVALAWAPEPYELERALDVYGASKTLAEQALWKFMDEQKPGFVLNTSELKCAKRLYVCSCV
jgi:nucleoside-diphosphate-sugar epimerase